MRLRKRNEPIVPIDGAIIQASQVVKTYDTGSAKVEALKRIDFSVQRGEMVAVMGQSGCGKTTLLNCLSGLDSVDSGQIILDGNDLAQMGDKKRTTYRARRMGFIFQVYNLLPVLSAVENVELPLLVSGIKPSEARQQSRGSARYGGTFRLGDTSSGRAVRRATPARHYRARRWSTTRPSSGRTNRPARSIPTPLMKSSVCCARSICKPV